MDRKRLEKILDKEFSELILFRDGGRCVRCSRPGSDCSHFAGRGNRATRWMEENCDTLCRNCHRDWEKKKRGEYFRFKLYQLGASGLAEVMAFARNSVHFTGEDLRIIRKNIAERRRELALVLRDGGLMRLSRKTKGRKVRSSESIDGAWDHQ